MEASKNAEDYYKIYKLLFIFLNMRTFEKWIGLDIESYFIKIPTLIYIKNYLI